MRFVRSGLICSLLLTLNLIPSTPLAAADEMEWSEVNLPTEGDAGGWALAADSDILHLVSDEDETLYCFAVVDGADMLFKSEDVGLSWQETGYEGGTVTAMVFSEDTLYLADAAHIYKSSDGAESFRLVSEGTLPAFDAGETITCLDVGHAEGKTYLFFGTVDADAGDFGRVYFLAASDLGAGWSSLGLAGYDVYSLACSPTFPQDSQILAAATDEVGSFVLENPGAPGDWSQMAELLDATDSSFDITAASRLCFPKAYDDELFVGVAGRATTGGIYRVSTGTAYRCAPDADIISLDLVGKTGDTRLMAGSQDDSTVHYSLDDGESWNEPEKPPGGGSITAILLTPDFAANGTAYAASSGTDSAFSCTCDYGSTWNGVSLIDTSISNILDVAPSPDYGEDTTVFLLTWGGEYSLWRSIDAAQRWERVFSGSLPEISSFSRVALSPRYTADNQTLFLAGSSTTGAAICKSTDNGQNFTQRTAPAAIDTWAVADDNTVFLGGYDGTHGLIYCSKNGGQRFSDGTVAGDNPLSYISLSPAFDADETILVGDSAGGVYLSEDDGDSFEPLPLTSFTGAVAVAFDPEFAANQTIYAASDSAGEGISRSVIGESSEWESIYSSAACVIKEMALPAAGQLYATNAKANGGLERCLNPTSSGTTFEALTDGLEDLATLTRVRFSGELFVGHRQRQY